MDRHGVAKALVRHAFAETGSPADGSQLIQKFVDDEPRLVEQACAYGTDESLELLASLHDSGRLGSVRLAKFKDPNIPFTPVFYGQLLAWLQERQVPVFIPIHELDVRDIAPTLNKFPNLDSILLEPHYVDYFYVKPLMRAVPRLHLELSRYEPLGEVEDLVDEFGAERFVYGSAYPTYAMGPVIFYLHHCRFTDEQLSLICGQNLERLIARKGSA
jgi:hypothetical protein